MGSDIAFGFAADGADISTHAPRVGSDYKPTVKPTGTTEFQLTLPVWGATFNILYITPTRQKFQLTLPVWGATMT